MREDGLARDRILDLEKARVETAMRVLVAVVHCCVREGGLLDVGGQCRNADERGDPHQEQGGHSLVKEVGIHIRSLLQNQDVAPRARCGSCVKTVSCSGGMRVIMILIVVIILGKIIMDITVVFI